MRTASPAPASRRASPMPPDERRAMIVRAAVPLLSEHGETVTTKQIAEAAGIAEGTIFRVFPDKDALIEAAVAHALDVGALDDALTAIDASLPLDRRVEAAVVVLQDHLSGAWGLVSRLGSRYHPDPPRRAPESAALIALLSAGSGLRVKPSVAARVLFGLTIATTHPAFVDQPLAAREVAKLFLHGAGRPSC